MTKKTVIDFREMKRSGQKIVYLTCYDSLMASFEEAAGVDLILVGDSVGNNLLGYDSTIPVTMDQMIHHCAAVRRGAPNTFIIGDMPFLSYQVSDEEAVRNAGRFMKEGGADAVKLEGGVNMAGRIKAINDAGILVMGHLGLTPQSAAQFGGWKAQGRDIATAVKIYEDAKALEEAGAFSILLEGIPAQVSKAITEDCRIPILGIGAGLPCDGQLLIVYDMLGMFQAFRPKFVKRYGELGQTITGMMKEYANDVRSQAFPGTEYTYGMPEKAQAEFEAWLRERKAR